RRQRPTPRRGRPSPCPPFGGTAASSPLRLRRRPGERRAGGQALKGVVAGVRTRRREADVEVEGVRVAVCRERAERDGAEAAEGTVVESGAAVDILVHLQVELARKSRAPGARTGQRVSAGKSPGIRDGDRP